MFKMLNPWNWKLNPVVLLNCPMFFSLMNPWNQWNQNVQSFAQHCSFLTFPHPQVFSRCQTCGLPCTTCCSSYCKFQCAEVLSFQCPQQRDTGHALPTKVFSHLDCCSGKQGCINQMKLRNLQRMLYSRCHRASCFGQNFYLVMKNGLKYSLD